MTNVAENYERRVESDFDEILLKNIQEHGHSINNVASEDDGGLSFSYSIGISHSLRAPELCLVNIPFELSNTLINMYYDFIKAGKIFEADKTYSDFLENLDVCFIKVNPQNYENMFGYNIWYYGHENFEVLQMVLPDKNGFYPWDEGSDALNAELQVLLNETSILTTDSWQ